jgi:glycine cleavage system H protein
MWSLALENPADLKYTETHEWVRTNPDGTVTVGITDHAQAALGEMVYVELPDVGRKVARGESLIVVESTKAASDAYAPLAGEIVAVNEALADAPQQVNEDPYGTGWLIQIRPSDTAGPGSYCAVDHVIRATSVARRAHCAPTTIASCR